MTLYCSQTKLTSENIPWSLACILLHSSYRWAALLLSSSEFLPSETSLTLPELRELLMLCANNSCQLHFQGLRSTLCTLHLISLLPLMLCVHALDNLAPIHSPSAVFGEIGSSVLLVPSISPWRSLILVWILLWIPSRLFSDSYNLAWVASAKSTRPSVQANKSHSRHLFQLPVCIEARLGPY